MLRVFLPLSAIAAGIIYPAAYEYTFLIRYLLMGMLFFSFLDINVHPGIISVRHFVILILNLVMPAGLYWFFNLFDHNLALAAFITAVSPTAIASPVILSLVKKKVEFAAFSVILTNIGVALALPVMLPLILGSSADMTTGDILFPVLSTIGIPLILSQIIKSYFPRFLKLLLPYKNASFYLLVINIYIASCKATNFITTELNSGMTVIFSIAGITLFVLFATIAAGWFVGGKKFATESAQSFGQKNNGFTLWAALTFINPVAALGPVFHILFQNIAIAWELFYFNRSGKLKKRNNG